MAKNPGGGGQNTVWEKNTPDPLIDLAARCVLAHPACLFSMVPVDEIDSTFEISTNLVPTSTNASTSTLQSVASPLSSSSMTCTIKSSKDSVSLQTGFLSAVSENLSKTDPNVDKRHFMLHPGLRLPAEICEKLFSTLHEEGLDLEDDFALAFGDPSISRIRSVDLSGSSVTDRGLKCLLAHKLRVLNIHNCRFLSKQSLEALNQNSESLLDLNVGNTSRFFPEYIYPKMDEDLVRKVKQLYKSSIQIMGSMLP